MPLFYGLLVYVPLKLSTNVIFGVPRGYYMTLVCVPDFIAGLLLCFYCTVMAYFRILVVGRKVHSAEASCGVEADRSMITEKLQASAKHASW